MPDTPIDRDHKDKCARFNSLAPFKIWRSTAVLDDAAKAAVDAVERHALLTEKHAHARALDLDHWKNEHTRLALIWHGQAMLLEANGWDWDEATQQYKPPRHCMAHDNSTDDTRDINPFASIATVESERVQRRNMRAGV
jgi:hypothetical protein